MLDQLLAIQSDLLARYLAAASEQEKFLLGVELRNVMFLLTWGA